MAEEFEHLICPMCGSNLVYSEGTHDLGCVNNPKPNVNSNNHLHEDAATYRSSEALEESKSSNSTTNYKAYKLCDKGNIKPLNTDNKICELGYKKGKSYSSGSDTNSDPCVFGLSFTESAYKGTLWSIRIVDEKTNYVSLMRLMQNIEKRVKAKEPLAANVPNLPKKIERNKVTKLSFRYNLEIEDLYSIKYSTETIERLAMFYNLTTKEVRHIKQTDIMED